MAKKKKDSSREIEDLALERWFEITGTRMDDLNRDIDQLQPGGHPADAAGHHAAIDCEVMEHPSIHPE